MARGGYPPGLAIPVPWSVCSCPSFMVTLEEWKVERDIWTVGLRAASANQLIVVAGSR